MPHNFILHFLTTSFLIMSSIHILAEPTHLVRNIAPVRNSKKNYLSVDQILTKVKALNLGTINSVELETLDQVLVFEIVVVGADLINYEYFLNAFTGELIQKKELHVKEVSNAGKL